MPAPKGNRNNPNGRPKGVPNKTTASVRAAFQTAFDLLQNDDSANLVAWGKSNTTEFYRLASKLIPLDVAVSGGLALRVVSSVPDASGTPPGEPS